MTDPIHDAPSADGLAEVHAAFAELNRREENLRRFRQLRSDLGAIPPTPPADGEAEELAQWLEKYAEDCCAEPGRLDQMQYCRIRAAARRVRRADRVVRRLHRLQQENYRFREPERTILCDLLANGTLLPDPDGQRYGAPSPSPAGEAEELATATENVNEYQGVKFLADLMRGASLYDGADFCGCTWEDLVRLLVTCPRPRAILQGILCLTDSPANKLLREARPQPVPVAEQPWERPGWCDEQGRCWIGMPESEYPLGDTGDYDIIDSQWQLMLPPPESVVSRLPYSSLPYWAIPIPTTTETTDG